MKKKRNTGGTTGIVLNGIQKKKKRTFDKIYVQDFGPSDDYHKSRDTMESIILKAKSLKSQYTNVYDFKEAEEIYNEYMSHLIDKCGGKKRYKVLKESGKLKHLIPLKPTLKMTEAVKDFMNHGLLNTAHFKNMSKDTKKRMYNRASEFAVEEYEEQCYNEGIDSDDVDITIDYSIYTDTIDDILALEKFDQMQEYLSKNRNIYNSGSDMDLIMDMFNRRQKKASAKTGARDLNSLRIPSMTQMMDPGFDPDDWFITEAEYRGASENEYINVNGRLVKKKDQRSYELAKQLEKYGYDLELIQSNKPTYMKSEGKDSDLFRSINKYKKMSAKEQKKEKKKVKKKMKKAKKAASESVMGVLKEEMGYNFDSLNDFEDYKDQMLRSPNFYDGY